MYPQAFLVSKAVRISVPFQWLSRRLWQYRQTIPDRTGPVIILGRTAGKPGKTGTPSGIVSSYALGCEQWQQIGGLLVDLRDVRDVRDVLDVLENR